MLAGDLFDEEREGSKTQSHKSDDKDRCRVKDKVTSNLFDNFVSKGDVVCHGDNNQRFLKKRQPLYSANSSSSKAFSKA